MDRYQAWGRYFHDYWLCYEKLYPWYTHGLRVTRYRDEEKVYATFERMCILVHQADKVTQVKRKLLKRETAGLRLSIFERLPFLNRVRTFR